MKEQWERNIKSLILSDFMMREQYTPHKNSIGVGTAEAAESRFSNHKKRPSCVQISIEGRFVFKNLRCRLFEKLTNARDKQDRYDHDIEVQIHCKKSVYKIL